LGSRMSRKWYHIALTALAYGILLAHTLVPHAHEHSDQQQHHAPPIAYEQHEGHCWLSMLQHLFHFDAGAEHLEKFQRAAFQHKMDAPLPVALLSGGEMKARLNVPEPPKRHRPAFGNTPLPDARALHNTRSLRAPPVV